MDIDVLTIKNGQQLPQPGNYFGKHQVGTTQLYLGQKNILNLETDQIINFPFAINCLVKVLQNGTAIVII